MSNIAPRMPADAIMAAKAWERQGKPATYWILDPQPGVKCTNCQDMRTVYLRFLSSHWSEVPPSTRLPVTWLEGDGQFHKGWRVVELTTGYPCPACQGTTGTTYTKSVGHVTNRVGPVKQATMGLAKQLTSPEENEDWTEV